MEKGAEMNPRPFLISTSIIQVPTYLYRQLFRVYFPSQFIELRGKSPKRGLDKTVKNREMWGLGTGGGLVSTRKGAALGPRPWLSRLSARVYLGRRAGCRRTTGRTIEICDLASA